MGKSLTFRGTVFEASELLKTHKCKDPICDTHLWKVKHELDMARLKMRSLEDDLLAKGITPTVRFKDDPDDSADDEAVEEVADDPPRRYKIYDDSLAEKVA
jgi:hypothetical protein